MKKKLIGWFLLSWGNEEWMNLWVASSIKKFKNFFNYGMKGYVFAAQLTSIILLFPQLSLISLLLLSLISWINQRSWSGIELKKFNGAEWSCGERPAAYNQQKRRRKEKSNSNQINFTCVDLMDCFLFQLNTKREEEKASELPRQQPSNSSMEWVWLVACLGLPRGCWPLGAPFLSSIPLPQELHSN